VDLAGLAYLFSDVARLLWRDAQGIEGSLDLASTEIRVGRAMDCAIRTDDAMVSRHHARVFWGGGGYVLEDLSSANGVYFQEQRVQSHRFKHGDAVRCGSLWLRFVDLGQASVSATPQANVAPMMQHHGMGAIAPAGPTGHVDVAEAVSSTMNVPLSAPVQTPQPSSVAASDAAASESEIEIGVLRRRVEQLQTELRVYRSNKFNQETARRMEDLERDLSRIEIERDNLKGRLAGAGHQVSAMTAETAASLHDLLASLRMEIRAAEGQFEQYGMSMPRASFEMINQSLKDASAHCDEARDLLRRLRGIAE